MAIAVLDRSERARCEVLRRASLGVLAAYALFSLVSVWLTDVFGAPTWIKDGLWALAWLFGLASLPGLVVRRSTARRLAPIFLLYGAWAAYVIASGLGNDASGLWSIRDNLQFSSLLLLVVLLRPSARELVGGAILVGVGMAFVVAIAPLGVLIRDTGFIMVYTDPPSPDLSRIGGTVRNPNTLATLGLLVSTLALIALKARPGPWPLLVLFTAVVTVVLSLSRSVTLLLGPILLWHAALLSRERARSESRGAILALLGFFLLVAAGGLVVGTSLAGAEQQLNVTRLIDRIFNWDIMVRPRWILWAELLAMPGHHPLFGHGVGNVATRQLMGEQARVVDSSYLRLWLEQGLLGCALFGALLGALIGRIRAAARRAETRRWGHLAAVWMGVALVSGTFASFWDMYPVNGLWWLLMGAVVWLEANRCASPSS